MASSLRIAAEKTPASRDRYVDFLRAFSICVVVLGHWLIAAVSLKGGKFSGENALNVVPGLWMLTWIFQVMPIFFFVGGFSNLVSFDSATRKGGGYVEFVYGRTVRLMKPTVVFLAFWIPLAIAGDLVTNLDDSVLNVATGLLTKPLWFIGIYLIVIALAPVMIKLHRRYGGRVIAAMVLGAIAADAATIVLGIEYAGFLNFGFVWLLVHQMGFFYADGALLRMPRKVWPGLAVGGLLILVALTSFGVYSASMVGLSNERSNTNPPTFAVIVLAAWQLGLVMMVRGRVSEWLRRVRVWSVVIGLNLVIMTMFLWHQTAMILAAAILYPLGFPQPQAGSGAWWAFRPLWIAGLAAFLAVLVAIFSRFERARTNSADVATHGQIEIKRGGQASLIAAGLGVFYVLVGILGFAISGLEGFAAPSSDKLVMLRVNPMLNVFHLVIGGILMRSSVGGEQTSARTCLGVAFGLALVAGGGATFSAVGDLLSLNGPDQVLHAVSAVALVWAAAAELKGPRGQVSPAGQPG